MTFGEKLGGINVGKSSESLEEWLLNDGLFLDKRLLSHPGQWALRGIKKCDAYYSRMGMQRPHWHCLV